MNLLLDTHTFLWAVDNHPQLSVKARAAIVDGRNIRMLIAQAQVEELTLVTRDLKLKSYAVPIIET
jgi:PIN domain nuclease of toxin-antitoxin system